MEMWNAGLASCILSGMFVIASSFRQSMSRLDEMYVTGYDEGFDAGARSRMPKPRVISLDERRERGA